MNTGSPTTNSPDGLQRFNQLLLLFGRKSCKNCASYNHLHTQKPSPFYYSLKNNDDDNAEDDDKDDNEFNDSGTERPAQLDTDLRLNVSDLLTIIRVPTLLLTKKFQDFPETPKRISRTLS